MATFESLLETWDGETWVKPYEPFCTLRCALEYARMAYKLSREITGELK